MIMMLRDDLVVEIFDDVSSPPSWVEGVDIENNEYEFCDADGQIFIGKIIAKGGVFRQPKFALEPYGDRDVQNAINLIDRAKGMEPNKYFSDLASLRKSMLGDGKPQ